MKRKSLMTLTILVCIIEAGLLVFTLIYGQTINIIALVFLVAQILLLAMIFNRMHVFTNASLSSLSSLVAPSYSQALNYSHTGILFYDDFYVITWMSDYLSDLGYNSRIGHKLLEWLPEIDELIKGDSDAVTVNLDEHYYRISKSEDSQVLFFSDTTESLINAKAAHDGSVVVGMINLDNFDESTRFEDESMAATINGTIRTQIINWCKSHHFVVKRIRNDRYYLVATRADYEAMATNDRFSILKTVRDQALELEVTITLSMAFAFGGTDVMALDDALVSAMDLAQQRGGDQVAIKQMGKDVVFYGGNSEASEKRSRVRARVMAHALRDMIARCRNVIIVGHKEADFDCIGSALGLASIVQSMNKPVSIVTKTGGIEGKLKAFMDENSEYLESHFEFISESQGLNELDDSTIVVMIDHSSINQSNALNVVKSAKQVVIIDHHRRPEDLVIKPVMVYIESGCSSASELICEFFSYMGHHVKVDSLIATLMYTGIVVDTQRFKNRTGQRTFDAASKLLDLRADSSLVDQILKDSYEQFEAKTNLYHQAKPILPGYYLVTIDSIVSRSFMSQIADGLLDIDDAKASFVMAKLDDKTIGISARSGGRVNVQRIMETLKGGGHRTAAAAQRNDVDMKTLTNELVRAIEVRIQEESEE